MDHDQPSAGCMESPTEPRWIVCRMDDMASSDVGFDRKKSVENACRPGTSTNLFARCWSSTGESTARDRRHTQPHPAPTGACLEGAFDGILTMIGLNVARVETPDSNAEHIL